MTRADGILCGAVAALLPWLYVTLWTGGGAGEMIELQSGSGQAIYLSLAEERTLRIDGPLGTSVIEIRDGRARFVSSPCRGKQCVHAGWLHDSGEFAACLPNLVTLAVSGANPRYDSLNF